MRQFALLLVIALFFGCTQETATPGGDSGSSWEGFEIENIDGARLQHLTRTVNGILQEEGFLRDGKKTGEWVLYYSDDNNFPKDISNYVDGELHGLHTTYTVRGQMEEIAQYAYGKLEGRFVKNKYGRITEEHHYKNGLLHGTFTKYHENSDVVQQQVEFKDGKEHGKFRFFNEQGELTVEYDYENGKKVGGGMVGGGN